LFWEADSSLLDERPDKSPLPMPTFDQGYGGQGKQLPQGWE
jgi:hypothetical protein